MISCDMHVSGYICFSIDFSFMTKTQEEVHPFSYLLQNWEKEQLKNDLYGWLYPSIMHKHASIVTSSV
jgi:hypothetical protein